MMSDTRLYGAAIAFASGLYSLWSASTGAGMSISAWVMLILGALVVVHGAVLLTGYADRLSGASGPLMIVYAAIMLLNQAALATGMMGAGTMGSAGTMETGGGMGRGSMTASMMGWDAGMVALAVLMLVSGLIMTRGSGETASGSM